MEMETTAAVVVAMVPLALMVSRILFYPGMADIHKSVSPFYSRSFVRDFICDASDGRWFSVRLLVLSNIQ
jgi:hypothetical protein